MKTLFIITFILALIFGLGFIFMPEFLLSMIGFSVDADGPLVARFFGILVFGISVLTFAARNSEYSIARQAIVLSLFVSYALMTVIHVLFFFAFNKGNMMLWSVIVIHALLSIAYGKFYFRKPAKT